MYEGQSRVTEADVVGKPNFPLGFASKFGGEASRCQRLHHNQCEVVRAPFCKRVLVSHSQIDGCRHALAIIRPVPDRAQERDPKQSVGVGFKKECFQLAVAFPLRTGRTDPVFYAGMNF